MPASAVRAVLHGLVGGFSATSRTTRIAWSTRR